MNTKNVSRVDIMVDLETLGKGDTPPVIQIAASAFDIKTGKVYSIFETYADISTINNIEGDTLSWWLNTNADLLHTIIDKGKTSCRPESKCFSDFIDWINEVTAYLGLTSKEVYLWGNGILFDNRIIKNKCKQFGFEYPIYYRNDMDVRTILEMAAFKKGLTGQIAFRDTVQHIEPAHNAAIDVKNQIADVCCAYKVLMDDCDSPKDELACECGNCSDDNEDAKKTEPAKEQFKQLGIDIPNPFSRVSELEYYYFISSNDDINHTRESCVEIDKPYFDSTNYFNNKEFAYQVMLHQQLYRRLLKYAYDNNAEDCSWDGITLHYYIYFDSTEDYIFKVDGNIQMQSQNVYFAKKKVAEQAIEDIIKPFMKEHPEFIW